MNQPTRLPWFSGVGTIFAMELRQRLRSRGFYWMLGVWFVVILAITLGVYAMVHANESGGEYVPIEDGDGSANALPFPLGQLQFELVLICILVLGALVAPAFAANAISGDRAGGTLAVVQSTLVTPGQIMTGKWLAAWVASLAFLVVSLPSLAVAAFQRDLNWGHSLLMLLAVAVELGILTWIGVGVSAWTSRPLFAIMSTYLLVALLGLGTLAAAGIAATTMTTTVRESDQVLTKKAEHLMETWDGEGEEPEGMNDTVCSAPVNTYKAPATNRFTWLLAANPVVLVADAAAPGAQAHRTEEDGDVWDDTSELAPLTLLRYEVRLWQAGPQAQVTCLAGKIQPQADVAGQAPVWPIGLGIQVVLAGFVAVMGRRKLVTPAGRLGAGTRVA